MDGVLAAYAARIPTVTLAGPTSFAPIIRAALGHVKKKRDFTILLILADGQVTSVRDTEAAIVDASRYPLSIVVVGVGDGPWSEMRRFDDGLPRRRFDNFHFVEMTEVVARAAAEGRDFTDAVLAAALAEVPSQFADARRLGLLA
jgi:E3 ubiquitin-protein ligase RGLG